MPIFIAIPTFQRADTFRKKTYTKIIQKYKLEKYITLFITGDTSAYKEVSPELKMVKSPKGLNNTLNFISDYYPLGAKIVIMDDDITRITKLSGDKLVPINDAYSLFNKTFGIMKNVGASLGGYYHMSNSGFMKTSSSPITTDLRFIVGTLYCYINRRIKYSMGGKSDAAFTIENYKRDGKVVRLNHYAISYDFNANTESAEDTNKFISKYSKFISRVITHKDGSTSFFLKKNPKTEE